MCSSLVQFSPGSRDLSQAEKRITVEQIQKITLKIILDGQSCHFVNLLSFT